MMDMSWTMNIERHADYKDIYILQTHTRIKLPLCHSNAAEPSIDSELFFSKE